MARPLWQHQREALKDLRAEFAARNRATGVMACGTGKTRVGAETAQAVSPGRPVLIVVPTLDLVAQTVTAWLEGVGRQALGRVIAVCGEKEVMDRDAADDLAGLQIEVTSDPGRLAELLREHRGRVTAAITYQSLDKLVAAHEIRGVLPWGLAVVDEAHRSAGRAGRKWSVIHDDVRVPAARRLYLTATPRLVTVGDGDLSEVASMDDEKVFGRVAHRLSFARARERGLLADYRVVVCVVTDEEMHRLATRRDTFLQVGRTAVSASMLARQVAVLRGADTYQVGRMLTYHRRVADARWFSQTLPGAGALLGRPDGLATGFVHGSQRRAQRRAELAKLVDDRLERVVISNARVLSEGYDAPAVDGIAFIDARKSTIDTVQAVGRALRLGGKKDKVAHIFVPVVMEPGQDPVEALQSSAYAPVWQVVSALAAHDEALGAELDARRRDLGRGGPAGGEGTLRELPRWLQFDGIPVPPRFAEAISVATVRSTTASWEEHLGAAAAYRAEHGDLLVPTAFVNTAGLALGQWVQWARRLNTTGRLSPARQDQLDELGMVWDVLDADFSRFLAAATAYHTRHGDLRIPRGYIAPGPDRLALGGWINNLRSRKNKLSKEQHKKLDELGMIWAVFDEDWKKGIEAARRYHQRHGHLRVPRDHVETDGRGKKGFPLGAWLAGKREQHKKLSPERIADLDALGMIWNKWEDQWRRSFEAARAFHAGHGHLDLPAHHTVQLPDGDLDLGAWLSRQRAEIENGTLSPERAAALEGLGVKLMGTHERSWQRGMAAARAYHAEFKNISVPARHVIRDGDGEEFNLGAWISKVRDRRIRGKLTAGRIAELDALGMVWSVTEGTWEVHLAAATAFYRTHRHLRIPHSHVTGPPGELRLGSWLSRQRTDFLKGKLSVNRIKALTKIGMRWPT
ncbi:Helicase associated domain protein [Streptomyces sp. NPDC000594]|uniref:DEAD/DEAH box helicase n=1 Tax=Streptomyces sp. NPDC000594 TaxID=3154261 RepID=UPI003333FAD3